MAACVLIVDDEPNIVISLEFLMKKGGYDVMIARDGDEALTAIGERTPDLILLDIMMPKRNGFEVLQELRNHHSADQLKVLMLTARGRDQDVEKGLSLGADGYITKPFSTRELAERVRQLLGENK